MIPRLLFRTVPAKTSDECEELWAIACELHPEWEHVTYREPVDEVAEFPISATRFDRCKNGAQRADLIRLEALLRHGGVYIDSDVELYRPLDSLLACEAFAAWEDRSAICNAVLGARPDHPAIADCFGLNLEAAGGPDLCESIEIVTRVLAWRDDVLVLPPATFYPYHWTERSRRYDDHRALNPWTFGAHHWARGWQG